MENKSNFFNDWLSTFYMPSCIVYSTEKAKQIIGKNNLKPGEFLRPFGQFSNNINFSFGDKFSINMKNFRINFYENDQYKKTNNSTFNQVMENVILSNMSKANWNLEKVK
jgi:hypothetical protein